ncbi:MAG: hypothetical protein KDC87_15145, partial [Planctomycetes bacterium]|nr:hypothetical protein [Planctomycetota bacterium]
MERRADVAYVRRLAHDTLQRSPTQRETRSSVGMPLEAVAGHFVRLRETYEQWLEEELYYYLLLDRFRPRTDAIAELPERLRRGRADVRSAAAEILLSTGFSLRNPGNDTFVTVVFEQFLGIEVQRNVKLLEAAKTMYDGKLSRIFDERGDSQSDVVKIALAQPGYLDLFVRRMEQRHLGEPLPDDEHTAAVTHLTEHSRDLRGLIRSWLVSSRYASADRRPRTKTDHQFIRSLFVDLLGRR